MKFCFEFCVHGQEGTRFLTEKPHTKGIINNIQFLPTSDLCFVTAGSDHAVILWKDRVNSGEWKSRKLHSDLHSSAVMGVNGLHQKNLILSVGVDKRVVSFDFVVCRADFKHQMDSRCLSILPNPTDFNLVMVQTGYNAFIWWYNWRLILILILYYMSNIKFNMNILRWPGLPGSNCGCLMWEWGGTRSCIGWDGSRRVASLSQLWSTRTGQWMVCTWPQDQRIPRSTSLTFELDPTAPRNLYRPIRKGFSRRLGTQLVPSSSPSPLTSTSAFIPYSRRPFYPPSPIFYLLLLSFFHSLWNTSVSHSLKCGELLRLSQVESGLSVIDFFDVKGLMAFAHLPNTRLQKILWWTWLYMWVRSTKQICEMKWVWCTWLVHWRYKPNLIRYGKYWWPYRA